MIEIERNKKSPKLSSIEVMRQLLLPIEK